MKLRIGNSDRFNSSRQGRSGMSELERLLHLFVSLQILFGSRRGIIVPLVVIVLLVGGWFLWSQFGNPNRILEAAHRKWDSGETQKRIEAVAEYKSILRKKDPIEPTRKSLTSQNERSLLYRRIIEYHVKFDIDERDARDWVVAAWQENIRDLSFNDEKVDNFYRTQVEAIRARGISPPIDSGQIDSKRMNEPVPPHSGTHILAGDDVLLSA